MSGSPGPTTKSFFLPAPIDGINLISPPQLLQDTEARAIENYYCFDWGLSPRNQITAAHTFVTEVGQLIPFSDPTNSTLLGQSVLICADHKFYKTQDLSSYTEVTHSGAVTTNGWAWAQFNKNIYLMDSANHTYRYDVVANTLTIDPYTGPSANLTQGTGYKSRFYGIEAGTSKIWYSSIGGIQGALSSFDVSQILSTSDNLLFVTSWSYNQGLSNDQLLVLCTTNGEILVYSGDYPAADNWNLITQTFIPKPINQFLFTQLGQDIIIQTQRGVVSLKEIIAGRGAQDEQYYLISRKLGNTLSGYVGGLGIARDVQFPFIYFIPDNSSLLYVLNFERGAWSRWNCQTTRGIYPEGIQNFFSIACVGSYLLMGDGSNILYKMTNGPSGSNATSQLYNFATKFFDLGNNLQKKLDLLRVTCQMRNGVVGVDSFSTAASASVNYDDNTQGIGSAKTGSKLIGYPLFQQPTQTLELNPPALGREISFIFSATMPIGIEIVGYEAIIGMGGVY